MVIYKMAAYGSAFELLVWLVGGLSAAGLVILANTYYWWAAVLAVMALAWLVVFVSPVHDTRGRGWRLAAGLAPLAALVLNNAEKLLGKAGFHFTRATHYRRTSYDVYDRDDLLDLIKNQTTQPDNRIDPRDLQTTAGALAFSDTLVAKAMTPIKKAKTVGANQSVGPMLMDELHKSGQQRFAVVRDTDKAKPEIVGTLLLDDVLEQTEKAKVREVMRRGAHYINESQNLRECLDEFINSRRYLLAVTDNLETVVGVIALEDVLARLIPPAEEPQPESDDTAPVQARQPEHKVVK